MANKTLIHLLIDLGADVSLLEKFKKDPHSVLGGYDLTDEEMKGALHARETGDPKHILDLISDEDKKKNPNVNVNIIVLFTSKE